MCIDHTADGNARIMMSVMAVSHLLHHSIISSFIFDICFNLAFTNTWKCGYSVSVYNETDHIASKAFNCEFGNHGRGRGKLYFGVRIPYSTNGTSTYQVSRRILFYLVTFKPTQGQVENEHRNILVSSVKRMSATIKCALLCAACNFCMVACEVPWYIQNRV